MHSVRWPVADFSEHVAQPALRLHAVQFAGAQQAVEALSHKRRQVSRNRAAVFLGSQQIELFCG